MKSVLAAVMTVAMVVPAQAGWMGTEWGQSPDEVIAAGGGAIRAYKSPYPVVPGNEKPFEVLAESDVTVWGQTRKAEFNFANNQLAFIDIDLHDIPPSMVLVQLLGKYGAPAVIDQLDAAGPCSANHRWIDHDGSSILVLRSSCKPASVELTYFPLRKDAGGL